MLIGLLRERLEELQTLPKLEKEAKKLWRRTRRAEKSTVRITLMLRSLRNRHDEAIEYGEISSESDDDDLLYDDDFDLVCGQALRRCNPPLPLPLRLPLPLPLLLLRPPRPVMARCLAGCWDGLCDGLLSSVPEMLSPACVRVARAAQPGGGQGQDGKAGRGAAREGQVHREVPRASAGALCTGTQCLRLSPSLSRARVPPGLPRHSSATAGPGPDVRRVAPLLLVPEQLPELRFDLRAPPRTGRNEFDDEDPGMYD